MRAVVISAFGGPDGLDIKEAATPAPGRGQVLVKVAAAGLNRADLLQRRGLYPAPPGAPQDIPGLEYAGVVAEVGPGTFLRKIGDRVMGIAGGGAFAEYLVAHERETVAVPPELALSEAAAIPEAFLTAYDALVLQCEVAFGDRVLVHAVGSGVGTAAVQLARSAGCVTIGTSRSRGKLEAAVELGLDHPVFVKDGAFSSAVRDAIGGQGVNVVMDFVGGPYLRQNLELLEPGGKLSVVGQIGGAKAEIPLGLGLTRRLTIRGTTRRARRLEEKLRLARLFERRLVPLFNAGTLPPLSARCLPVHAVPEAIRVMCKKGRWGKGGGDGGFGGTATR